MDSQAHRDRAKEAAKKRRKYLWKKVNTSAFILMTGSAALICALVELSIITALFTRKPSLLLPLTPMNLIFLIILLTPFAAAASCLAYVCHLHWKKTLALPYIPPVAEQIAALPAEEVLLRGSDPPNATPEELLRAAQAGTVEPKEELLRAEQERFGEQPSDMVRVQQTRP